MDPLDLIKLTALMDRTSGSPELKIGLIDGPVVIQHPDLAGDHLHEIPGNNGGACTQANSAACLHGTFVAGILSAKRGSVAPAICPNCTLLARSIFAETEMTNGEMPSATLGSAGAIGASGTITFGGGTLQFNGTLNNLQNLNINTGTYFLWASTTSNASRP